MDFLKKYWFLIAFLSAFIGESAVAQYRLTQVEGKTDKMATSEKVQQIEEDAKEAKKQAEKEFSEAKKERRSLEAEQKKTTVLEVNQSYIIKGMDSMNAVIKELADEIRESRRRRQ